MTDEKETTDEVQEAGTPEAEAQEGNAADAGTPETATMEPEAEEVKVARPPEFMEVEDSADRNPNATLDRFLDVEVVVSAELGRVNIPLGDLVGLGEGSVVELNRSVTSPVDLMAQGKRVATGEIVVIDDCFAIRIKSIDDVDTDDS